MLDKLTSLFIKHGFDHSKAKVLSAVFTENSLCGVTSHGINRVPLFIDFVKNRLVDIHAEAAKVASFGNIERWDGNSGPGILNAIACTNRASELAKIHGMGMVALKNTNHWMRGGYYGWLAAQNDCMAIMFTNTKPNMPAWGGKELRIGNNPFVVSIPNGNHPIILDMAMSQFSFGKIDNYAKNNQALPVDGGWDELGQLSKDPNAILKTGQSLPIGYWKGSALSIVLDMLATVLSAGESSCHIGRKSEETGLSQVFICINNDMLSANAIHERMLAEIIDFTHSATPLQDGIPTYYPGEQSFNKRAENIKSGIPVNADIWSTILAL